MNDEDQLNRKFEELDFSDEPAMASQPEDDIRRGERRLRRRRTLVVVTAGLAAGVVMATGAVAVLPNALRGDATLQVAGGERTSSPTASPSTAPTPSAIPTPTTSPRQSTPTTPTAPANPHRLPYPETRQLLLDKAVEHLDPQREHLPAENSGFTGGSGPNGVAQVGEKLDWTVRGEDGMGMIRVLVTSPGYADQEYAFQDVGRDVGCLDEETGKVRCEKQRIPGTSEQAWVAPSQGSMKLGVLYERPDGSYVGIGVFNLFGNNTNVPVSNVDVSLEQALAFVADPELQVVPGDDPGDLLDK